MEKENQLSAVFRSEASRRKLLQAGYFFGDLENHWGHTSGTLTRLGLTDTEMRNGGYQRRIHPEDLPNYMHNWDRLNNGLTDEMYCEYRVADNDGTWHWIETHAVVLSRTPGGAIGKVAGFDRRIDVRKQSEEILQHEHRESQRKLAINEVVRRVGADITLDRELHHMLDHAVIQIAEVIHFQSCEVYTQQEAQHDKITRVFGTSLNGSAEVTTAQNEVRRFLGMVSENLYPIIVDSPGSTVAPESPNAPESPYLDSSLLSLLIVPLRVRNKFIGCLLLWRRSEEPFCGDDLYPALALTDSLAAAVYNRSYYQEQIKRLEHDELTGFLTRLVFERTVPRLWVEYQSLYSHNSVAMIDIDNFKPINDSFGHAKGDHIIRELARLLRDGLRREDLLIRYGGEEFVAIFPNTDIETAEKTIDRIRTLCNESSAFELQHVLSFSAGVAECYNSTVALSALIETADAALYSAKRAGRNRVHRANLSS
ncbi:MAG: sensor domain-containing diguanylate cyclase [Spirochaeta sp.]|nr:sensor domain-containing diguanylate cyclase [Spirochaeta sp.]